MMAVMVLFYLVALDGVISKIDGIILVLGLVLFMVYLVVDGKRHARKVADGEADPAETPSVLMPVWKKVAFLIGGIAFLAVGARLMVYSAVNIAESLGVEPVVVGLTIVAIGTSLPELAASLVSAVKQEADMSIGNVLGSNLLNVLFVVGLVAIIRPLQVDAQSLSVHFPVMLGFSALLLPVAWTSYRISRFEGGLLLGSFAGYIVYLVLPYF